MNVGFLGPSKYSINSFGTQTIYLPSLEDAEIIINEENIDLLLVKNGFSSCSNLRDIVIYKEDVLAEKFRTLNPDINIIFIH